MTGRLLRDALRSDSAGVRKDMPDLLRRDISGAPVPRVADDVIGPFGSYLFHRLSSGRLARGAYQGLENSTLLHQPHA